MHRLAAVGEDGRVPDDATRPGRPPSDGSLQGVLPRARDHRARADRHRCTIAGCGDEELLQALDAIRRRVQERTASPEELALYGRLLTEREAIDEHDAAVRRRVTESTERVLDELAACPTSWELVQRAAVAVCEAGGFTRSLVSAVRGVRWVPLVVHTRDDLDPKAETFRAFVSEHVAIPLANMLGETEIARRRTAMRFTDPVNDRRTFKTIILEAGTPAYAAAPIVVGSRTLGFVHVDRVGQDQPVTEDDRIALAAFADGLGWLVDRAAARRTLDQRASEIDAAIARARAALDRGRGGLREPMLGDDDGRDDEDAADAPARRDALLTGREREVLELVAEGATNWAIAQRLTLSEDTVKAHLRSVRRKLHVKSRGAAVARYRRITRGR